MQCGKIIIHEAQTVIQYAASYVILLTSQLHQSPVQCLHFLGFDQRFYHLFKHF